MKFNSHIKHKTKPKLLHLLLSLILTISMTLPMFTAQTLEVHADPTDTTGQDSSMDNTGGSNGLPPNYDRSGWLFFVCDSNRQLLTPVLFFTGTNKSPSTNYDATYLTSRIGNQQAVANMGKAPWGAPVTNNGSNWQDVKEDMNERGLAYVKYYFGDSIYNTVKSDTQNVHVILETVCWHNKPGKP